MRSVHSNATSLFIEQCVGDVASVVMDDAAPESRQNFSQGINITHTLRHAYRYLPVRAGHARDHLCRPHQRSTRHSHKQAHLQALLCLPARYRGHGPLIQCVLLMFAYLIGNLHKRTACTSGPCPRPIYACMADSGSLQAGAFASVFLFASLLSRTWSAHTMYFANVRISYW